MITGRLLSLAEPDYAAFQARLLPTVDRSRILGVRVPALRRLAKELYRSCSYAEFLRELPHTYYDETMLHALLISEIADFDACVAALEAFLPFVDNWAVCDSMSPRCFAKRKEALLPLIRGWIDAPEEYTVRFGLSMLMRHFLDGAFRPEYLALAASVQSDRYYVNMMLAFFFATALAKQWDAAIPYLESAQLAPWIHDKTIQKARESFRITPEQKVYLSSLKKGRG